MAKKNHKTSGLSSGLTADHAVNSAQFSKYGTKGGHGFAAEDANALYDLLRGKKVFKVGLNNAKSGADRIVNGMAIQTKYGRTAADSVNMAFSDGKYRYPGMMLEVPSDQYDQAVERFKLRILRGEVFDQNGNMITDPNKAKDIVSKGTVTYKQAVNLAKAGTIESLTFDAANSAVICGYVGGITFLVNMACAVWSGASYKEAAEISLVNSVKAGCMAGITNIAVSQVSRTFFSRTLTETFKYGVTSAYKSPVGRAAIQKIAEASLGKAVYGGAAINHVSKLMGSNVITGVITTTLITAPDFYHALIKQDVSWTQFSRNLISNAASVAGGAAGGLIAGATLGSFVPGVGTAIGGILGAVAAGMASKFAAEKISDVFSSSDEEKMLVLINNSLSEQAKDFLLNENEFKELIEMIKEKISADSDFVRNMYGSSTTDAERQAWFTKLYAYPICMEIASKRPKVPVTLTGRCIATCQKAFNYLVGLKDRLKSA